MKGGRQRERDSRLLLLVCGEQSDPEASFTFGNVLLLHAAHQTSQQVQLLFGQRVRGFIQLLDLLEGHKIPQQFDWLNSFQWSVFVSHCEN